MKNAVEKEYSHKAALALWAALLLVFFTLSTLAVPSNTQLVFSVSLLLLIAIIYTLSRGHLGRVREPVIRLSIIFLCTFLLIRYLYWRATETMPMQFGTASMICGLLLFLAELYTIITALLGYFINANPRCVTTFPYRLMKVCGQQWMSIFPLTMKTPI